MNTNTLKERLAKIREERAKAGVSLVPTGKVGKRGKTAKEPLTPLLQLSNMSDEIKGELADLIGASIAYQKHKKAAEAKRKPITERIKELCNYYKLSGVEYEGSKLRYIPFKRTKISAKLLMDKGVSVEIIKACTEETTDYQVRIMANGEEEWEDIGD